MTTESGIRTMSMGSLAYEQKAAESAKLSVSSSLTNGKVVLTTTLTKEGLAGLQVIMNYDSSKLTLDNVIFDAGSTITNFSTKDDGRLTFGSIDQLKTARIKTGTPYKLIFTPKVSLAITTMASTKSEYSSASELFGKRSTMSLFSSRFSRYSRGTKP